MTARTASPQLRWLAFALAACMTFAGLMAAPAAQAASTVTLCIKRSGPDKGTVRFVGGTKCKKMEQRVQLVDGSGDQGVLGIQGSSGETGPQGPPGPKGDKGDQGLQGLAGADGIDGEDGTDGTDGIDGIDGIDGENGADGQNGIDGQDGADGLDGENGTDGIDGLDGENGQDGADGVDGQDGQDGRTVLNGDGAPSNDEGVDGDFYLDTSTNELYGPKAGDEWPVEGVSLVGPPGTQGPAGVDGEDGTDGVDGENGADGQDGADGADGQDGQDGRTVLNGEDPPSNDEGVDGDFYLDILTTELYGPKAGGEWPLTGVALKGADGADGEDGTDGENGIDGIDGENGADGQNGIDGIDGIDGQDGRTVLNGAGAPSNDEGVDGDFYLDTATYDIYGPKLAGSWSTGTTLVGPPGQDGEDGQDGQDGEDGEDGAPGAQGPAGPGAARELRGGGGSSLVENGMGDRHFGPSIDGTGSETAVQEVMLTAGTVSNLRVFLSGSPSTDDSYTFSVRRDPVGPTGPSNTTISCTIVDSETSCSSPNSQAFAAGDTLVIRASESNNPQNRSMFFRLNFQP